MFGSKGEFKLKFGYEAIDKYAGNNWEEISPLDGSSFIDIFYAREEKLTALKPENFESIEFNFDNNSPLELHWVFIN